MGDTCRSGRHLSRFSMRVSRIDCTYDVVSVWKGKFPGWRITWIDSNEGCVSFTCPSSARDEIAEVLHRLVKLRG